MDRLDSWLNRQRSWRLALVHWILLVPAAVALGCGTYGLVSSAASARASTILEVAAWSAAAAAPLAILAALTRRKRTPPWRRLASAMLICTGLDVLVVANQFPGWPHLRRTVVPVALSLLAVGLICQVLVSVRSRPADGRDPG